MKQVSIAELDKTKRVHPEECVTGTLSNVLPLETVNNKEGNTFDLRKATLTDSSGNITVAVWGENCIRLAEGRAITIENPLVKIYQNVPFISVGKRSKLVVGVV